MANCRCGVTMRRLALLFFCNLLCAAPLHAEKLVAADHSRHTIRLVPVAPDVKLEVLDWGGSGPPLVFLSGLGDTAHVFDEFAPKFTTAHHVYAITRRGFGASSAPRPTEDNYFSDRLGDDVYAVIQALKLDRPVLVGHSIAGEELSSVANRHPDNVGALIYLDAAYARAFYYPGKGDSAEVDLNFARRDLDKIVNSGPHEGGALVRELEQSLPNIEKGLPWYAQVYELPSDKPDQPLTDKRRIENVIINAEQKYASVRQPKMAIFAIPLACSSDCNAPWRKTWENIETSQMNAFKAANPSANVLQLRRATHYVYRSNEAEVERAMNQFMDGLPKKP